MPVKSNPVRDTKGITMNILQIIQLNGRKTCAFVEWPDGVTSQEVLRHWTAMQGLSENAVKNFDGIGGPVIPWSEIKDAFTPFSEMENKKRFNQVMAMTDNELAS